MALFWQNLLKTVFLRQNGFILENLAQNSGFVQNNSVLAKARQNCVVWPKWLYFGESRRKTTVLAKIA